MIEVIKLRFSELCCAYECLERQVEELKSGGKPELGLLLLKMERSKLSRLCF
jgi:hypothetical protein